jgi:hypothetical protein
MRREDGRSKRRALNEARCKKLGLLYAHLSYFMKETGWN